DRGTSNFRERQRGNAPAGKARLEVLRLRYASLRMTRREALLPLRCTASALPLIDLHQLDIEHEVAAQRTVAGIGESFGNPEAALLSLDHQLHAFRPRRPAPEQLLDPKSGQR